MNMNRSKASRQIVSLAVHEDSDHLDTTNEEEIDRRNVQTLMDLQREGDNGRNQSPMINIHINPEEDDLDVDQGLARPKTRASKSKTNKTPAGGKTDKSLLTSPHDTSTIPMTSTAKMQKSKMLVSQMILQTTHSSQDKRSKAHGKRHIKTIDTVNSDEYTNTQNISLIGKKLSNKEWEAE